MTKTVFEDVDEGPWELFYSSAGKLEGIISDDFEHDVVLYVNGDFPNIAVKEFYCTMLMEKLNGN